MRALYSLNIFLYGIAIRIASLFNSKAKRWLKGRKDLFRSIEKSIAGNQSPVAWFHCASLGEFEQGRPLMERLRKEKPEYKILLTFFSPSGYEVRRNYPGADFIFYLPLDTPGNARRFVSLVKPSLVFFVKYEFWLNHLRVLAENNIPHFLVSAVFRSDQAFFKNWGGIFRKALQQYAYIFTQDEKSLQLLGTIGIKQAAVAGDTRFDRVAEIAASAKEIPIAEAFAGENRQVLVAGSSWPQDETLLFPAFANHFANGWKMLIAPHELGESHLASIEQGLVSSGLKPGDILRFSCAKKETAASAKALIIDNIGMLSSLYRYGKIAYIGGGFGKSIHNILEAAVYGMPVIFGPAHRKFNEALNMISNGSGIAVSSGAELAGAINDLVSDEKKLQRLSSDAGDFVKKGTGATGKILQTVFEKINR